MVVQRQATAMAKMGVGERGPASLRLVEAMAKYPLLVAGEGRACSELMSVIGGRVVLKTGAEGVYTAILPKQGLGIALKIEDGATRGSECAIAALLVRLGLCDVKNPMIQKRMFSKFAQQIACCKLQFRIKFLILKQVLEDHFPKE